MKRLTLALAIALTITPVLSFAQEAEQKTAHEKKDEGSLEIWKWVNFLILAGGLDPWNLTQAVQQSGAPLLDVSSGVERGAGLKDPALIRAFLDAAKSA